MRKSTYVVLMAAVFVAASVGSLGGPVGCGNVVATDTPGVFVPDASGIFDRFSVTPSCDAEFDTVIEIVQHEENLILQAGDTGFPDYTGTIGENGAITLTGTSSDGAASTCTGTFVNGSLSELCSLSLSICTTDAPGVETCTATAVSCSVAYERR